MKKIINGKKYDTETAESIATYYNNYNYNDFNSLTETLFKKKTGEFFLYGQGGPMTCYAEHYGNSRTSGEKIIPFTIEQAKIWVEEKANDKYEEIFGECEE